MANQYLNLDRISVEEVTYPKIEGFSVMIITPNDFYRKKFFALGPAYVATAMIRCGVDVNVMSCDMWSYDDIEIAKIIIESNIKYFFIGAMFPMIKEVERLCKIIHSLIPEATIILGGALPTSSPSFSLKKTGANIAVVSEAELTILSLMPALAYDQDLSEIKGIMYVNDGKVIDNGKPSIFRNISKKEVGWPAFDLFPIENYITAPKFYPFKQTDRILPISSGRGCPYDCNFCFRPTSYRLRPIDDLLDEMEYLIDKYNLNGFYFADDLTMANKKRIYSLCNGILDRGLNIKFNMYGRVNTVDSEMLSILKQAGCVSIFYGLESGSQKVLDSMKKHTSVEQIKNAVQITRDAKIYCDYAFMYGQPSDNKKSLQDTVNLIKEISYGEYRSFRIFGCVPFPGSPLFDLCIEKGILNDYEDFYNKYISKSAALDQVPINMTALSDDDLNTLFISANNELEKFFLGKTSSEWIKFFSSN